RRIEPTLAEPQRKRRHRSGLADFVRREFFSDALLLMRIVRSADGRDLAVVHEWEEKRRELETGPPLRMIHRHSEPARAPAAAADTAGTSAPGPRRRRRRRRRRSSHDGGASPASPTFDEGA